jgi:hypothetical protein
MASLSPAEAASPRMVPDRWTAYSVTVWAICMLGFAFDIYEATIMQLVTPLLIKEWGIAPATIGSSILDRNPASSAGSLGPAGDQREPTFRACH